MTEMIIGFILLGFGIILIILTLIYRKLNQKSDNKEEISNLLASKVREKVVEAIAEKYSKIEEKVEVLQKTGEKLEDFRNLFTNKTERGKLGEDWLEDIIRDAVSKKYYEKQYTFSNGKRVDFLLNFGSIDERVSIDSKFTWEDFKKMQETEDSSQKKQYAKNFAENINKHINAVSEYIIPGETAPIALMFVASEGVFRAIEGSPQNFVKKARAKDVIIVSPNTIFACLKTYRLLIQNREMYKKSSILQKEVGILGEDVSRLMERFSTLGDRQEKVSEDYKRIKTSIDKISNRSEKIKNLDLEEVEKIEKKK